jgi:hypothetical protein
MSFILLGVLNSQAAAGGLANSYDLLATEYLGASTTSWTISNINTLAAGYTHLQLRVSLRTVSGAGNQTIIYLNSDTATNYAYHNLEGNGSSVARDGSANTAQVLVYHGLTTNEFAPAIIDFLDFANSNKFKVFRYLSGRTGTGRIALRSGLWRSTSAITSITFSPAGGSSLQANSKVSIYGIK